MIGDKVERIARFVVLNILGSFAQICYSNEQRTVSLMRRIATHYGANLKIHKPQ